MVVLTASRPYALAHELGYALGGLGDEYDDTSYGYASGGPRAGADLPYPNLTTSEYIDPSNQKTIAKTAKWGHCLSLDEAYPLVSAYQGGAGMKVGVWRPSYRCVMRNGDFDVFCPVCHEVLTRKIYKMSGRRFQESTYRTRYPLSQWR